MESASDSAAQEVLPVPDLLKNLSIQKDEPLFAQEFSSDQDIFNHEAFADALLKLILANNPPLSVGLFGSWGIGKSTIVNILKKKIDEGYSERLKLIYFNAWKYSGDSFRRQFLLEMATQVFGKGHSEVERLKQLNYGDVLRKDRQQRFLGAIKEAVQDAMSMPMALRSKGIARFILGCLTLLGGVAIAAGVSSTRPVVATFIIGVVIPAVFLWFADMKFEDLFVVQETPLLDPKMIFPEQFESEFHNILQSQQLKDKRAVIAIDDIDRCEPAVIKDILISMKTFMGHEQCFFIVPCDDKTVIDVFADPKQAAGYGDESLRKYFNVGLRIPPITSTDLVDFANTVARKTKLPDEIIQIAVLANCRDARKMKHFLNSLAVKYTIAKGREKSKVLSASVDDNLSELAKAVLLEDSYPNLFEQIVENPRIYDVLERAALNGETEELAALGLTNWEKTYPRLREILERTRDTQMLHADVFFSLKSTNPEVKMPRGTEYKTAVIEGNTSLQEAIISQVTTLEGKVAVADLLLDLVKKSKGRFLHNAIDASLRVYRRRDFFEDPSAGPVRRTILSHILYRDATNVVTYDADSVMDCAKDAGAGTTEKILIKYQKDLKGLDGGEPPQGIKSVIETLYQFQRTRVLFASILNEKLAQWTSRRSGLQLLKELKLPNDLNVEEKIPNAWLTEIVAQNVTLDVSQLANDGLRLGIISKISLK